MRVVDVTVKREAGRTRKRLIVQRWGSKRHQSTHHRAGESEIRRSDSRPAGTTSAMANIPSTSRPRELPMGEEEAGAELKLGEFQRIPALSLSETRLLLHVVIENRRQKQKDIRDTE